MALSQAIFISEFTAFGETLPPVSGMITALNMVVHRYLHSYAAPSLAWPIKYLMPAGALPSLLVSN